METEMLIVGIVRRAMQELPPVDIISIHARLADAGVALQSFDLDYVLARHQTLFYQDHRGEWLLMRTGHDG